MKLGQVFDPRRNALNALRLALAAEVMLFHSWPITGHMPPSRLCSFSSRWVWTGFRDLRLPDHPELAHRPAPA